MNPDRTVLTIDEREALEHTMLAHNAWRISTRTSTSSIRPRHWACGSS